MPYRFKKQFRDAVISIPSLRLNINRFNLTDELAEKIFKKYPQFAHNLELTQDPKEMDPRDIPQETKTDPELKELQSMFDEQQEKKYVEDPLSGSQAASEIDAVGAEEEIAKEDYDLPGKEEETPAEEELKKKVTKPKATGENKTKGKGSTKKP